MTQAGKSLRDFPACVHVNLFLYTFKCVLCGVLHVFETVTHQLHAAKPTGDADDAITDIHFLHNTQNDHSCIHFTVIMFRFIDCPFVCNTGSSGVVRGVRVFFILLESRQEIFDVLTRLHPSPTYRVATPTIFDDHLTQFECALRLM